MDFPNIRTSQSPGDKTLHYDGEQDFEQCLWKAVNKYLEGGAYITKDAPRLPKGYRQLKPGNTNPFDIFTNVVQDTQGEIDQFQASMAYIVTLNAEAAAFRYTTGGQNPSSTYGMLVPVGSFIDIVLVDLNNLKLCAVSNSSIINMEVFEVAL